MFADKDLLQSSNVATYIAQGDVALSVLMTTASTLGAIIMTPTLTKLLAGAYIAVDAKVRLHCMCCNFLSPIFVAECKERNRKGKKSGKKCLLLGVMTGTSVPKDGLAGPFFLWKLRGIV